MIMPEEWQIMLIRIVLAVILSGFIGLEREFKRHPAGFRTHLLVGVGSCMMMLLSLYGFEEYMDRYENIRFDPARIPSYVISGIGFLGAGTILVRGVTVRGLTTAASIWVVAGLGLVVGAGMYPLAIFSTLIVLLSLIFLNKVEAFFAEKSSKKWIQVNLPEDDLVEFTRKLEQLNISVYKIHFTLSKPKETKHAKRSYLLEIGLPKDEMPEIINELLKFQEVKKVF
ncbi:hypothetical protein A3Q35_08685 [Aeribacillus pallidus]|nr:hypothetical protein A3Q35_08685 [Aeribacillus pallidus]